MRRTIVVKVELTEAQEAALASWAAQRGIWGGKGSDRVAPLLHLYAELAVDQLVARATRPELALPALDPALAADRWEG